MSNGQRSCENSICEAEGFNTDEPLVSVIILSESVEIHNGILQKNVH